MINIQVRNTNEVWFSVAYDEPRVYSTSFGPTEKEALQSILCSIPFNIHFQIVSSPSAFAERLFSVLKGLYDGLELTPRFSLATENFSPFYRRVLEATGSIPTGYVTSYGAIAEAAGGGPRAVGHVMATNPFPPIIPCHRVVRSDFTLGGYGGGLDVKLQLLSREKRGHSTQPQILFNGKALRLFPVEFVFRKMKT